jgi:hypothetical protein
MHKLDLYMSEKAKSTGKKQDSKPKVASQQGQEGFDPGVAAYESLLAAGGQDIESINAFLDHADEASRIRVVDELRQAHGNSFVQRMVAQRQEHGRGSAPAIDSHQAEYGRNTPQTGEAGTHEENRAEDWARWREAAKSGAKTAIQVFSASAILQDITVNMNMALGGNMTGPSIAPLIQAMMMGSGAPGNVAAAFGRGANAAWQGWVSRVFVPGLPWYPSFVSWPGPMAPPMPNIPTPLISITRGATIDAGAVASAIKGGLGDQGEEAEAQQAADDFGSWLSTGFIIWSTMTLVRNVMGKGPVPSFAPPYVPTGPVVGGDAFGMGVLVGPGFPG